MASPSTVLFGGATNESKLVETGFTINVCADPGFRILFGISGDDEGLFVTEISLLSARARSVMVPSPSSVHWNICEGPTAVALAAKLHGCRATIVMPHDAPALKLAATRGYGAEVVLYDRYKEDRSAIAKALVEERGAALIPPFDHLPVMAGQGTTALELIEDVGALDALIVCAGGGGLLSGCTVAAKHLLPNIAVFGAEPERGNDMQQSLLRGEIVSIDVPRTICDGQQTQAVGVRPFEVIRALVKGVLAVPDPVVVEAMRFVFERMKVVLEPSGACALAALMHHREQFRGQRVGITLSGGNIGTERFVALITGAERVD